ncbi:MAG: helix-turn-helix transcriptional regulator [Herbaspirillum sp.]
MFGRIAIRNIPQVVFEGLEKLSQRHDRSVEAEARYAIRSWVEPLMQREEQSARRMEVAVRLREILEQVNSVHPGKTIKPSHVAQVIGESHAEAVENWFSGKVEPSFVQLERIAHYLGCAPAWLQHGDGSMIPKDYVRLPEQAMDAIAWLLDEGEKEIATQVFFVRSVGQTGSLAIVKCYDRMNCKIFSTPYHVSEEIGAGGESSLACLFVMWHLLYELYGEGQRYGVRQTIKSFLMAESGFKALLEGNQHPLILLKEQAEESTWWEDIWDVDHYPKRNYWSGWKSLCDRIRGVIEFRPRLAEERQQIAEKKHPAMLNRAAS